MNIIPLSQNEILSISNTCPTYSILARKIEAIVTSRAAQRFDPKQDILEHLYKANAVLLSHNDKNVLGWRYRVESVRRPSEYEDVTLVLNEGSTVHARELKKDLFDPKTERLITGFNERRELCFHDEHENLVYRPVVDKQTELMRCYSERMREFSDIDIDIPKTGEFEFRVKCAYGLNNLGYIVVNGNACQLHSDYINEGEAPLYPVRNLTGDCDPTPIFSTSTSVIVRPIYKNPDKRAHLVAKTMFESFIRQHNVRPGFQMTLGSLGGPVDVYNLSSDDDEEAYLVNNPYGIALITKPFGNLGDWGSDFLDRHLKPENIDLNEAGVFRIVDDLIEYELIADGNGLSV